jgi:hypothetical protein
MSKFDKIKLERIEKRIEFVKGRIWELSLADRLIGEERTEFFKKHAELRHLYREWHELRAKCGIA